MRLYFGLIIAALGFAAVSGTAMSWDVSYILFKILDLQSPFLPHGRLVNIPLHWMVLLVNRFTSDLSILQTVFGLVYAVIPFIVLALSWWVVHGYAEPLFIWVALGVGFGTLPGQLCFACEAIFAILLFWPIILAILLRIPTRHAPTIFLLVISIFFTHPVSIILFALAAGCAFVMTFRSQCRRIWLLTCGVGLIAMAILKSLMFLIFLSPYESSLLSMDVLKFHFAVSVSGLPLMAVICAWFAASMIFIAPLLSRSKNFKYVPLIHWLELISLITAGALLVIWARDPSLWMYATSFRLWALFSSLPFMLVAALEALIYHDDFSYMRKSVWSHRLNTIQIIGVCFLVVLSIQSTAWFNLTKILRETITHSADNCISLSSMGWPTHTLLHNLTTTSYSILLQGRAPRKLVLDGDGCTEASFSHAVRIAPWDLRSRSGGWFDLHLSGLPPTQK
jgi:hypothetical protein